MFLFLRFLKKTKNGRLKKKFLLKEMHKEIYNLTKY
jgi:hypothetical protein